MREIFFTDDTPVNRISYYLLLLFVVSLPLDRLYSELALIVLFLHTLLHPASCRGRVGVGWTGWWLILLYLVTMAGTVHSADPGQAWGEWEKQLAFLLFPLIALFTQLDWQRCFFQLVKALGFSCFFTILYLYAVALRMRVMPLNHAFSAPLGLHATYLAMYTGLSIIVFAWLLFRSQGVWVRTTYGFICLVMLAGLLQLASRAVLVAVLLSLNLLVPFLMTDLRQRRRLLLWAVCISGLCVGLVYYSAALRLRYVVELRQDLSPETGNAHGPEPRMARWQCAWELIRAAPWTGYGTGSEEELLKERYLAHHLKDSWANGLNAHNEYLSCWLKTGIVGLLVYLLLLGTGFVQAVRCRDPVFLGFLVIITVVSFSENILDVNKGIFFVSFFCTFSAYGNKNLLPVMGARAARYKQVLSSDPGGGI